MYDDLIRIRAAAVGPRPVRLRVNLQNFAVEQQGFIERRFGDRTLYVSPGLAHLESVAALADSEYGQAVEVDRAARTVTFGKDYLGHYPLNYVATADSLYISDDVAPLVAAMRREGLPRVLSAEAVALYFATGFGPHGMTPYRDIVSCESASLYCWRSGKVTHTSLFRPLEVDEHLPLEAVETCIRDEARKAAVLSDRLDVWCSGGLDSAIVAWLCNSEGRSADLVTLGYDAELAAVNGGGERAYAEAVAREYGARLREATLSIDGFIEAHRLFIRSFNTPSFDAPPAPKFALAQASRDLFLTGEGGDPFFGGPKNSKMIFSHQRNPETSLGWFYAAAHERFAHELAGILVHGAELTDYVVGYFDRLFDRYPGELPRKLMYLNALFKPSSTIFAQSYYSARHYGLRLRHPLASLTAYRAAFALPDRRKYRYPRNKIVLTDLFGAQMPECVTRRKKGCTVLPLGFYLERLPPDMRSFSALRECGLIREEVLDRMSAPAVWRENVLLYYALISLNAWLESKGVEEHADLSDPAAGDRRSGIGLGV